MNASLVGGVAKSAATFGSTSLIWLRYGALIAFLVWAMCAWGSATIPWTQRQVTLTPKEQPLRDFLRDLMATQGLAVVVSPAVTTNISGSFKGKAETIFRSVVQANALLPYYDGSSVFVYSASEAVSRTVSMSPSLVSRVLSVMSRLGMDKIPGHTFNAFPKEGLIQLSGSPRYVEQVREIVAGTQEQALTDPVRIRVFPLKHAIAWDQVFSYGGQQQVVPGVASLVRATFAGGKSNLDRTDRQQPATVQKLKGKGMAAIGREQSDTRMDSPKSAQTLEGFLQDSPLVGASAGARIEADRRNNAVIIADTADRMPFYEELINSLDTEPMMIEIEAMIIDIKVEKLGELGINWRYRRGDTEILFGRGDAADPGLRPSNGDIIPQGRGLLLSAVLGGANDFVARINALDAKGDANIVSRPQVVTLNNFEAFLDNSRSVYVRVAGFQEVDLFNVTAGTYLRVTPSVTTASGRSMITLITTIEDGRLSSQTVDQIPIVDRSFVNTQALIHEGESLLVGGLRREETSNNESKIPLLGDIPILGYAFKYGDKRTTRTERMFLITPRVVPRDRVIRGPERMEQKEDAKPNPDAAPRDGQPDKDKQGKSRSNGELAMNRKPTQAELDEAEWWRTKMWHPPAGR